MPAPILSNQATNTTATNTTENEQESPTSKPDEIPPSVRVMTRVGDHYVGDVDGDGTVDTWKGFFTADNRFGRGEFEFNDLKPGVKPNTFKTKSGLPVTIGDRVRVETEYGDTYTNQNVAGFKLTVTNPLTGTRPDYLFVGISFYTLPPEKGLGMSFPIDAITEIEGRPT